MLQELITNFPKHIQKLETALTYDPKEVRVVQEFNQFNLELSKIKNGSKNPEAFSEFESTLETIKGMATKSSVSPGVVEQLFVGVKSSFESISKNLQAA